ncbi:hypothetical protein MPNT_550008 [Candidatus Methylacidithermus pantelleriae]|uniref:Uncharacterized protein n=1 Tax=Candidatus Methylacidithermus pantelleriae TaxID=2744239 RepID=A0A8J2BQA8_9BACT|nr:hypothetical protein MPNT_550008 [Candidatus Methylacidithermus pantelleriae]
MCLEVFRRAFLTPVLFLWRRKLSTTTLGLGDRLQDIRGSFCYRKLATDPCAWCYTMPTLVMTIPKGCGDYPSFAPVVTLLAATAGEMFLGNTTQPRVIRCSMIKREKISNPGKGPLLGLVILVPRVHARP